MKLPLTPHSLKAIRRIGLSAALLLTGGILSAIAEPDPMAAADARLRPHQITLENVHQAVAEVEMDAQKLFGVPAAGQDGLHPDQLFNEMLFLADRKEAIERFLIPVNPNLDPR